MPWTIQLVHVVLPAQVLPSVLEQIVTRALRRTASDRANCSAAVNSLVCPLMRLFSIIAVMLGTATSARMPMTATVTISSTKVKPRDRSGDRCMDCCCT